MLKKIANFSPRGYQFLGANVRPGQATVHKALRHEDRNVKSDAKNKEVVVLKSRSAKDGFNEMKFAENLLIKILKDSKQSTNTQVEQILEFCKQKHEQNFRTSVGEKLYLWCSGVVAATGVLVCQKWLSRDAFVDRKFPTWFSSQTIQRALTASVFGVPRDRLLLSVKATGDGVQSTAKDRTPADKAALNFKARAEECTASILNKLGMDLMSSNQEDQAFGMFRAASEAGHLSGIYNMGLCFEHGRGVPQNIKKSIEYYEVAASRGHGKSQYNLATLYAKGTGGLEQSHSKTIELLSQAAENGIAKAQVHLGLHFAKQKKEGKSAKYFSMASNQKDVIGIYHYAVCLETGWGVPKDVAKAGLLYKEAAEMGHVSAMFNTAVFYEHGHGGFTKSRKMAMDWYENAADLDDKEAKKKLKELLATPKKSRNLMHPILRDILALSMFSRQKPEQGTDFHRSRSAPNLGEIPKKLSARDSNFFQGEPDEIVEEPSASLSCGLQVSDSINTESFITFGVV